MKKQVVFGLLAFVIMGNFSSCFLFTHDDTPDHISYHLAVSFQDTEGNDLIAGIGLKEGSIYPSEAQLESGTVKSDLYWLNITASQSCEDILDASRRHYGPDRIDIQSFDGYYFLKIKYFLQPDDCPDEKVLTYKLQCPYVFGDHKTKEFIAYWETPQLIDGIAYPKCLRIEYEGKTYTPTSALYEEYNKVTFTVETDQ